MADAWFAGKSGSFGNLNALPTGASLERERQRLANRLERVERRLALSNAYGSDDYSHGEVVWFRAEIGCNNSYTYAAIKVITKSNQHLWYLTGVVGHHCFTWEQLVAYMIDHHVTELYWASEYTRVAVVE